MKAMLCRMTLVICAAGTPLFWPTESAAQETAESDTKDKTDTSEDAEVREAEPVDTASPAEDVIKTEDEKVETTGAVEEVTRTDDEEAETSDEQATDDAAIEETPTDGLKILQGTWTKNIVFATDDGSFRFQPRGWVQPRFLLTLNPEAENVAEGTGFSLKRARFGFQAWLFDWARFYLDTGFESGTGRLIDYFVDVDPFDGVAVLRIGRFRPYVGRQFIMATTKLAMIEYAQAWQDGALGLNLGRDIGAGIHGLVFKGLEYGVGVWNGENRFDTDGNLDFEVGGRIAVHPLALAGVGDTVLIGDESDAGISKRPGLVIGAAAFHERRHDLSIEGEDSTQQYYDNQFKLGIDVAFKYIGLSIQGEFFLLKTWIYGDTEEAVVDMIEAADNEVASNLLGTGIGTYLQAGYFILTEQLEVIGRFDMVDEDTELRGLRFYPAVGATYYLFGHNLKAQLMYRLGVGTGYEESDSAYMPTTHDIFLMFQASI
ncbi:MAG: hypothetical protein GY832_28985 [Chloroflexi bacterium]|nr:hypothetical protein [Chloroflexota bacterium]